MRRIIITAAVLVLAFIPGHLAFLCVLAFIWALAMSTTNTPKARGTETRVSGLENQTAANSTSITTQTTRVNNLSGRATSTGLPAGQPTSNPNLNIGGGSHTSTSSSYPTGATSGQQGSGTSHYHDYGGHYHDFTHTHDFQGHTHDLPAV